MSDTLVGLSAEEIERYKPYHTWTEFTEGYDDYHLGVIHGTWNDRRPFGDDDRVKAYDLGQEAAIRHHAASQRKEWGLAVFV